MTGLVLKSSEGLVTMGLTAGGVALSGVIISAVLTRVVGHQIRDQAQARQAMESHNPDALPEQ